MAITKKVTEKYGFRWRPKRSATVYQDDLEKLFSLANQVAPEARGETDLYEDIERASELRGRGEVEKLIIRAGAPPAPAIAIHLGRRSRIQITTRDSLMLETALNRAAQVIEDRYHRFGAWSWPTPFLLLAFAMLVPMSWVTWVVTFELLSAGSPGVTEPSLRALGTTWLGGFLLVSVVWNIFGRNPDTVIRIVPTSRAESPTWWDRHGTQLLIAVGIAIGALIVGLLAEATVLS